MSLSLPHTLTPGTAENVQDVQDNDVYLAGQIDTTNAALGATNTAAGVSSASGWRGKSIISTVESRSNTAYATLTTPDQVTGIVLPGDGLIQVMYHAEWLETGGGVARAAIFVGSNQLKVAQPTIPAPQTQAAANKSDSSPNIYGALSSCPVGLVGSDAQTNDYAAVTTGQAVAIADSQASLYAWHELGGVRTSATQNVGGPCCIFAAAGTYTISVRFKATSGTVTVRNRKLWVSAQQF